MSERYYYDITSQDREFLMQLKPENISSKPENDFLRKYQMLVLRSYELTSKRNNISSKALLGAYRIKQLDSKILCIKKEIASLERTSMLRHILFISRDRISPEEQRKKAAQEQQEFLEKYRRERALALEGRKHRLEIIAAMGLEEKNLTPVQELAVVTVLGCKKHISSVNNSFIGKTDLTIVDAIAFAGFAIRELTMDAIKNHSAIANFRNEFTALITTAAQEMYSNSTIPITQLIEDRFTVYDNLSDHPLSTGNIPSTILETFELFIEIDTVQNKFIAFADNLPVTVPEFTDKACLNKEINQLHETLLYTTRSNLERIKKEYPPQ